MTTLKIDQKEITGILKKNLKREMELVMGEPQGVKCIYCHRKLSKPESMERHAGIICHRKAMLAEALKRQLKLEL